RIRRTPGKDARTRRAARTNPYSRCRIARDILRYCFRRDQSHREHTMATHVKILGWLHLLFGALGVLGAFAVMGGTMLGGFFTGSLGGMIGLSMIGTFAAVIIIA